MKNILDFLTLLQDNNKREWFNDNKSLYEQAKSDFESFVNLLIVNIKDFDPDIDVNSAKECIFRIYKDVRFSKNKDPYKTNMGAYIVSGGKKSELAGYYMHIEPGGSFAGGGIYCPQPDVLKKIREDIYQHADTVKDIIHEKTFKSTFPELYGEQLKTVPKGYPKDFKDADLLKFKDYTVIKSLSDKEILSNNLIDKVISIFKIQKPFNTYLNRLLKN
jgi:uncharacterized protein (TIGR02453 family)